MLWLVKSEPWNHSLPIQSNANFFQTWGRCLLWIIRNVYKGQRRLQYKKQIPSLLLHYFNPRGHQIYFCAQTKSVVCKILNKYRFKIKSMKTSLNKIVMVFSWNFRSVALSSMWKLSIKKLSCTEISQKNHGQVYSAVFICHFQAQKYL